VAFVMGSRHGTWLFLCARDRGHESKLEEEPATSIGSKRLRPPDLNEQCENLKKKRRVDDEVCVQQFFFVCADHCFVSEEE
jgi:hypothetical protein